MLDSNYQQKHHQTEAFDSSSPKITGKPKQLKILIDSLWLLVSVKFLASFAKVQNIKFSNENLNYVSAPNDK